MITCDRNTRRGRKKEGTEGIFETIITKDFLKLMSDTKQQIQEVQKTPNQITKKTTPIDIIFKLLKIKD